MGAQRHHGPVYLAAAAPIPKGNEPPACEARGEVAVGERNMTVIGRVGVRMLIAAISVVVGLSGCSSAPSRGAGSDLTPAVGPTFLDGVPNGNNGPRTIRVATDEALLI